MSAGGHRRQRPGRRRRLRKHEQRRVLLHRYALGWRPQRCQGARRAGSGPHDGRRPALPGPGRNAGDRRELAPPVRHFASGARRARGGVAPARGGRAEGRHPGRGNRPSNRADPPRRRADRHRRAPACRHLGGVAEQAQTRSAVRRPGRDGHRRQRQRAERRGVHVCGDHSGEGRRIRTDPVGPHGVLGPGRCGAQHHGHRSGARHRGRARPRPACS